MASGYDELAERRWQGVEGTRDSGGTERSRYRAGSSMMAFVSQWMTHMTSRVVVGHGCWCARTAGVRYAHRINGHEGQVPKERRLTRLKKVSSETPEEPAGVHKEIEGLVQEEPRWTPLGRGANFQIPKKRYEPARVPRGPEGAGAPQPARHETSSGQVRTHSMSAKGQKAPKESSEEVPPTFGKPAVELEELWMSGKYGTCQSCGGPVKIPGLSHQLCPKCGWVLRPEEDWKINRKKDLKSSQHMELEETDYK